MCCSAPATPNCFEACVTDVARLLAALSIGIPALAAALMWGARTPRQSDRIAQTAGLATAAPALALSALAIVHHSHPLADGRWLLIDGHSGLLLAVTALVGLSSVMVSRS